MDTKRSQSLRKVPTPVASKQKTLKTQSQASVTPPSPNGEQNKEILGDKNPLDALSRNAVQMRPAYEHRSGLQDIDEEYMKQLDFSAHIAPPVHDYAAGLRTPNPAEQEESNAARTAQQAGTQKQLVIAQGKVLAIQAIQQQQQQQQQLQQNQEQQQQQQQLHQNQEPQPIPQQQVNYSPAAGEPEMCTTCPNCQTIIYLTQVSEEPPVNNSMHGQPDGTAVGTGMP